MFQGQFDLEDQGEGHQFSNSFLDLYVINTWFKFEGKIQNDSKVIPFTRNQTDDDADKAGTKNNMSLPGRGGGGDKMQH